MGLDIRLAIGALFATIGLILSIYGALSSRLLYERSLGININLLWGLVLVLFGLAMGLLGWRSMKR